MFRFYEISCTISCSYRIHLVFILRASSRVHSAFVSCTSCTFSRLIDTRTIHEIYTKLYLIYTNPKNIFVYISCSSRVYFVLFSCRARVLPTPKPIHEVYTKLDTHTRNSKIFSCISTRALPIYPLIQLDIVEILGISCRTIS